MNLAALSLRDLEYVVAVATHLHFGKAARACSVSQPTLSAQLRKLEDYIGFGLFERTARSVIVTERGAHVIEQARVVLRESRRLLEIARASGELLTGTFRLGLIATLGPYITPLLLQPLRERLPRLQLVFSEGLASHLVEALASGEVDAVLAVSPLQGPDLAEYPMFREDLVLAIPREHRLAQVEQVGLEDIDPDELILLGGGHCLHDQVLSMVPSRTPGVHQLQAASLESLRQMVGAGMGCTLMPRLAVQVGALLDDMVCYRVIRSEVAQRSVSMFHRSTFGRMREVGILRDLMRDVLHAAGTVSVHRRQVSAP